MFKNTKKTVQSRQPRLQSTKQKSFHYSSLRALDDRNFDRKSVVDDQKSINKDSQKQVLKTMPGIFSVVLIVLGIIYLLTLSTKPHIIVTNPSAKTQTINKQSLNKKTEEVLKTSILNRLKMTFRTEDVSSRLLKVSPEIDSASISINLLRHSPSIKVTLSEPSVLLSNNGRLFVIGSSGKVLADVTRDKTYFKTDNLPLLQDNSTIDISVGKIALTSLQVDYINQMIYQTSQAGVNVSSMDLVNNGSELDVKYGKLSYYVKYNFFEDARKSSGVFLATKANLEKDKITPAEYIDVRVPERAYVK